MMSLPSNRAAGGRRLARAALGLILMVPVIVPVGVRAAVLNALREPLQDARHGRASALPLAPASAEEFAARIDHHYNALHSLSVAFTQQYDGLGIHRTESGILLLKRGGALSGSLGKMRWTYTDPAGKLFVMDGREAWFYTPGQTEVTRVEASKLDDLRSPMAFLLGHAELAKQLSGLKLERTDVDSWTVTGVPRGLEKRVASIAITAHADGTIEGMRVEETDGAVNTFRLSDEQPDAAAPAQAFVFVPPPGTHVVDGMPPM